ncbi:MAG: ESPR-type extended signal peptide-containing protein, partial [Neisseria sp.]|nr:ESPR-type extended signal peptide-containing protein [Neisseria sp.]
MNNVFKVVWNTASNTWTATSELAKGKTKSAKNKTLIIALAALAAAPLTQANTYVTEEKFTKGQSFDANARNTLKQDLENKLKSKVDTETLTRQLAPIGAAFDGLGKELAKKASQTELNNLQNTVNTKAAQSDVNALTEKVNSKAEQSALNTVQNTANSNSQNITKAQQDITALK